MYHERPTYKDIEPKMSYKSKQKRKTNQIIRYMMWALILIALAVFVIIRLVGTAHCVSAEGSMYESYQCPHSDRCCEQLPPFNADKAWQD